MDSHSRPPCAGNLRACRANNAGTGPVLGNPSEGNGVPFAAMGAFAACVDPNRATCQTRAMSSVPVGAVDEFLDAVLARDFSRIEGLLDEDIDFRAMTPSRIWEAENAADVSKVLRTWFEHPERHVEGVEPIASSSVADTLSIGWQVHGQGADGPFLYEQQAYVREQHGRIVWLRIMCSGPRPI